MGRLNRAFEGLLDYYFIHFCTDLGEIKLPEAMLKYENARLGKVDICSMVLDFLDFGSEVETVYADFITMNVQKIAKRLHSLFCTLTDGKRYFSFATFRFPAIAKKVSPSATAGFIGKRSFPVRTKFSSAASRTSNLRGNT